MTDAMHLPIPVSTTDTIPGRDVQSYCGLARGCSTRSAALQTDLIAQMRNIVGGEIPEYTKVLAECREEALDRLIEHARSLGANAVVGMRFCTSEVAGGTAELVSYGTAVKIGEAGGGD